MKYFSFISLMLFTVFLTGTAYTKGPEENQGNDAETNTQIEQQKKAIETFYRGLQESGGTHYPCGNYILWDPKPTHTEPSNLKPYYP